MRFATLIQTQETRTLVASALQTKGIEVSDFATIDALVASLRAMPYAAILIEDIGERTGRWLRTLQIHTDEPFALIAIGPGGTAGMSRALMHGADDYAILCNDIETLVHRCIARVSEKTHRPRLGTWRLGPYTLDSARKRLLSPGGHVTLSPREVLLARTLIENHGKVVPLSQLCEDLCSRNDATAQRAVQQHAHVLRKKCELAAGSSSQRLRIEAVYGKGYRLTL